MSRRKRVLVDVDGVVGDFLTPTCEFVRDLTGEWHDPATFGMWDVFDVFGREHQAAVLADWHSEGWCARVPVYAGAVEGIRRLREVADVLFVTAPMPNARHWMWERDQWLRRHFGATDHDIIFCTAKEAVAGDMLVDDKPSNIAAWHRAHPSGVAVLWDAPTNASADLPSAVVRCGQWEELCRLVG